MVAFNKDTTTDTPFGVNQYLRSTAGVKYESYTVAAASVPSRTIDGVAGQKPLQRGTVMAKITAGPDTGKIGPYQAAGTAEVQTLTPSGTISGGTYTLTLSGQTTTAIAYNATAATVQAALEALSNVVPGDVVVAGGPLSSGAFTFTFYGNYIGDAAALSFTSSLTGSTPNAAFTTTTPGVAGAADGRQTTSNIVGILDTFLPWQLTDGGDREVAVAYEASAVQGWVIELNAAGTEIACQNATATAMQRGGAAGKGVDITWK